MASDPLDDLLDLEDNFYQEGYDLGVTDGQHAGLVEGKLFGIEKGFEKALALARLHGRAQVWTARLPNLGMKSTDPVADSKDETPSRPVDSLLGQLGENARVRRHVNSLLMATDPAGFYNNNTDEAVAEFDERVLKANAKVKVIANILGENSNVEDGDRKDMHTPIPRDGNIEDAGMLPGRK